MKYANRFLAIILSIVLLIGAMLVFANAASAYDFADFPAGTWSEEAMLAAVNNGLLTGRGDGTIAPKSNLTRAEAAAIINRAFGATVKADISAFNDVSANAWYYQDVQKAVNMGTFVGASSNSFAPESYITRESMLTVLARALVLSDASGSSLFGFSDGASVSSWASAYVNAMAKRGYVNGNGNGSLNPQGYITREEFAQVMHNIFKVYISNSGDVKNVTYATTIVRAPDVNLENVVINGDLVFGDGVGKGDVTLKNVKVTGRILFRGGEGKVHFVSGCTVGEHIIVHDVNGTVNFNNYQTDAIFKGIQLDTPATFLKKSFGGGGSSRPVEKYYTVTFNGKEYDVEKGEDLSANSSLIAAMEAVKEQGYETKYYANGVEIDTTYVPTGDVTITYVNTPIVIPTEYYKVTFGGTDYDVEKGKTIVTNAELVAAMEAVKEAGYETKYYVDTVEIDFSYTPTEDVEITYVNTPIVTPPQYYKVTFGGNDYDVEKGKAISTNASLVSAMEAVKEQGYTTKYYANGVEIDFTYEPTADVTITYVNTELEDAKLYFKHYFDGDALKVDVRITKIPEDIKDIAAISFIYSYDNTKMSLKDAKATFAGTFEYTDTGLAWYSANAITAAELLANANTLFTLTFDVIPTAEGVAEFKFVEVTSLADSELKSSTLYETEDLQVQITKAVYVVTFNGAPYNVAAGSAISTNTNLVAAMEAVKEAGYTTKYYANGVEIDFAYEPTADVTITYENEKIIANYTVRLYSGVKNDYNYRGEYVVESGDKLTQAQIDAYLGDPSTYNVEKGYTDSDGKPHEITPELWYNNGKEWVLYDVSMPITRSMDICLLTRYIKFTYDTNLSVKGIDIPATTVTVAYNEDTNVTKTLLDIFSATRRTLGINLDFVKSQGYDVYQMAIDKAASTGLVDTDGNILNPRIPIPLSKILTKDLIMREVDKYIDQNLENEEFIAEMLATKAVQDMLLNDDSLRKEVLSDTNTRSKFLTEAFIKEVISSNDTFVENIINSDDFVATVLDNDATLDYVLNDPALVQKVMANPSFRDKIIEEGTKYAEDTYFGTNGDPDVKAYIEKQLKSESVKAELEQIVHDDPEVQAALKHTLETDAEAEEILKIEIEKIINGTDPVERDKIKTRVANYLKTNYTTVKENIKTYIKSKKDDFKAEVKTYIKTKLANDDQFKADVKQYIIDNEANLKADVLDYILTNEATLKETIKQNIVAKESALKGDVLDYILDNESNLKADVKQGILDKEATIKADVKQAIIDRESSLKADIKQYIVDNKSAFESDVRQYINNNKSTFETEIKQYIQTNKSGIIQDLKADDKRDDILSNTEIYDKVLDETKALLISNGFDESKAPDIIDKFIDGSLENDVEYEQVYDDIVASYESAIEENFDDYVDENYSTIIDTYFDSFFDSKFETCADTYLNNNFADAVSTYLDNDFAGAVSTYLDKDFAGAVSTYLDKDFAGAVSTYLGKDFAGAVSEYLDRDFSGAVDKYLDNEDNYDSLFATHFEGYYDENYADLFAEYFETYYWGLSDEDYIDLFEEHYDTYYHSNFEDLYDEYFEDYYHVFFDSLYEAKVETWAKLAYDDPDTYPTVISTIKDVMTELVDTYVAGNADQDLTDMIDKIIEQFDIKKYIDDNYSVDPDFKQVIDDLVRDNAESLIDDYVAGVLDSDIAIIITDTAKKYAGEMLDDYVEGTIEEDLKTFIDDEIDKELQKIIDDYVTGADRDFLGDLIPKYADKAVQTVKDSDAFKTLIAELSGSDYVTVNKDNKMFVEMVLKFMDSFTYDNIKATYLPEKITKLVDLVGDAPIKKYFDGLVGQLKDGIEEAVDSLNADLDNGIEDTSYKFTTRLAVRINYIADFVYPIYNKIMPKVREKLYSQSKLDFNSNPYAKRLIDMDMLAKYLDKGKAADEVYSGYALKDDILDYYDVTLELMVLMHDAVVWYGDVESQLDALSSLTGRGLNKINSIITEFINTGSLPKGFTLEDILNKSAKVEDLYERFEDKIEKAYDLYENYLDRDYTDIVDFANISVYADGNRYKLYQLILEDTEDAFDLDNMISAVFDEANYHGVSKLTTAMSKVKSKLNQYRFVPEEDEFVYVVDAYKATLDSKTIKGHSTGDHTVELHRYLRYFNN